MCDYHRYRCRSCGAECRIFKALCRSAKRQNQSTRCATPYCITIEMLEQGWLCMKCEGTDSDGGLVKELPGIDGDEGADNEPLAKKQRIDVKGKGISNEGTAEKVETLDNDDKKGQQMELADNGALAKDGKKIERVEKKVDCEGKEKEKEKERVKDGRVKKVTKIERGKRGERRKSKRRTAGARKVVTED